MIRMEFCAMPAALEALKVKAPATPGVRESLEGETVTPEGKPLIVTDTELAKLVRFPWSGIILRCGRKEGYRSTGEEPSDHWIVVSRA